MKKTTKRILAIVLCVAIGLSTVAIGSSLNSKNALKTAQKTVNANQNTATEEFKSDDVANTYETLEEATEALLEENKENPSTVYPLVVVPGMGMSRTTVFNEDGTRAKQEDGSYYPEWTVFNLLPEHLKELTWPAVKSLIAQKDVGLIDKFREIAPAICSYHTRGTDTKMKYNVQAYRFEYPVSQYAKVDKDYLYRSLPFQDYTAQAGEENTYVFNYASLSNTYEEAEGLHKFIQMVKEQTGAEKVNLLPISLGGTVTSAYFDLHADANDVYKVVSIVAAWNGSDALADLLSENYTSNSKELLYTTLLPEMLGKKTGNLLNIALRLFPNKLLREIVDAVVDEIFDLIVINTTSMWSLVPHEKYKALAEKHLSDPEHAYVKSLADRYYNAQSTLKDRMYKLANEQGVKFYFISGYNLGFGEGWTDYQYFKFFDAATKTNSDGIINISSTGVGTSYVTANTAFSNEYKQNNPNARLSPDGSIDAATSYFPDRIWYFEGQHHEIAYNNIVHKLVSKLLLTDEVNSVEDVTDEFPQFNESRNIKRLSYEFMPAAKRVLNGSTLSQNDRNELRAMVDNANAMMDRTIADRESDDEIINALYDKLVDLGELSLPQEPKSSDKAIEWVLEFTSDILYKALGHKGFSEILKKANN